MLTVQILEVWDVFDDGLLLIAIAVQEELFEGWDLVQPIQEEFIDLAKYKVTLMGLLERSMALRFLKVSSEGMVVILLPWKEISAKALNLFNTLSKGIKSLMFLSWR